MPLSRNVIDGSKRVRYIYESEFCLSRVPYQVQDGAKVRKGESIQLVKFPFWQIGFALADQLARQQLKQKSQTRKQFFGTSQYKYE